ncbi:ABC transporter permease [Microbacterium pumilum]|uniref:Transport permease protein n=1 Tax=Microbacterium pumilum TaxID=344165 RepID=A0ABP5EIS3_9MICO
MTTLAPAVPGIRPRISGLTAEGVFVTRSLRHSLRDGESLSMSIMLPVMLMLLFTFVFGGAIDPSGGYVNYVVPGIILLCAGFGAATTAVYVSRDMQAGIIDRFRTMPLRPSSVLTGHVVASLLRNLIATGVVIAVALLVGFRPTAGLWGWLGAIGIIALYILAITYLFAAIGLAAQSPEGASGYGFIILFIPYLSSAFVPVESMPTWLQWFADNQPITPIIETIRALLMGTAMEGAGLWAIGWCVAILAIAFAWGAWLFRKKAGRR